MDIVRIVVDLDAPLQYAVGVWCPWDFRQTYLDAGGTWHKSEPGMKLRDPPTFEGLEEALQVAESYLS